MPYSQKSKINKQVSRYVFHLSDTTIGATLKYSDIMISAHDAFLKKSQVRSMTKDWKAK